MLAAVLHFLVLGSSDRNPILENENVRHTKLMDKISDTVNKAATPLAMLSRQREVMRIKVLSSG